MIIINKKINLKNQKNKVCKIEISIFYIKILKIILLLNYFNNKKLT